MRLSVEHVTHYRYSEPPQSGLKRLRLYPKTTNGQQVLDWQMELDGVAAQVAYDDQHNNHITLVTLEPGVTDARITCRGTVLTDDKAGIIGHHSGFLPLWHFLDQTELTRPGPEMRALVSALDTDRDDTLGTLHALSASVREAMIYATGRTQVDTTAEEALSTGHGVCQDHAQVFVGAARLMGIPARYVSGYLMIDDRIEQEAGHAWAEAHIGGLGWVGFDISNGICPDPRYIRVATGRDYGEAAPVTELSFGSGETSLDVTLTVELQPGEQ